MATAQQVAQMKQVVEQLHAVNKERLLRSSLGEESLDQAGFVKTYETIINKADFALQYAGEVDGSALGSTTNMLQAITNLLSQQAGMNNTQYVGNKSSFINQIENSFQQLNQFWPHFVTAAIEARGFLKDEGIRKEYERTVSEMKSQADEVLKHVKEESDKTIAEARQLADDIEKRARRTAAHISVQQAQEQFKEAQTDLNRREKWWAGLAALSLVAFLAAAIYLARVHFPEESKWYVIYFTAIRITILTAIGAVATFCLRILRSQMHMSQHNRHRQRVANSMAAFVEAAVTPEQRDLILSQMVNAVVDFGSSGLIGKEEDSIYTPKMTIDSITRTIAQPTAK